jgi:hypothetical protein
MNIDDEEKTPSLDRDWSEVRQIIESARLNLPTSPNMEADPESSTFLKIIDGRNPPKMSKTEILNTFRHHAVLIIRPTPKHIWDRETTEELLDQDDISRVPVHGEQYTNIY